MASLTILSDGAEQRVPLEQSLVTLGRGLESDIRLKDIKASRRHCQIQKTARGYQCLDLSSGNGTYVNGVQIKQQLLATGDTIQIGSTTITFHDEVAASARPATAARSKAATVPVPKAVPAAGAPPLRASTAQVPSVRPIPPPPSRPPVAPSPGSGQTSVVKKRPPARPPGSGSRSSLLVKSTHRAAAAPAAKKKMSRALLAVEVVAGILVVGAVAFVLLRGGDVDPSARGRVRRLVAKAAEAQAQGKADEAAGYYEEALQRTEGVESLKRDAMEIRGSLGLLNEIRKSAGIRGRIAAFKLRAEKAAEPAVAELLEEGRRLKAEAEAAGPETAAELKAVLERLEKSSGTPSSADPRTDAVAFRKEVEDRLKQAGAEPDFSSAVQAWNDFLERKIGDDARTRAREELRGLQARARDGVEKLKKQADGLEAEGKRASLVDLLKRAKSRFDRTEAAEPLDRLIRQYDN